MNVQFHTEREQKGHSFSFELLAYLAAEPIVSRGPNDAIRPVWAVLAMGEASYLPVRANLHAGRPFGAADYRGRISTKFETPKSFPYTQEVQRTPAGTIVTLYYGTALTPDPGFVDPAGISFAVLTPSDWMVEMRALHEREVRETVAGFVERGWKPSQAHLHDEERIIEVMLQAPLFASYLDRRTRVPLIPELKFQLTLLAQMLTTGAVQIARSGYRQVVHMDGVDVLGYAMPLVCDTRHGDFERTAALTAAKYLDSKGQVDEFDSEH